MSVGDHPNELLADIKNYYFTHPKVVQNLTHVEKNCMEVNGLQNILFVTTEIQTGLKQVRTSSLRDDSHKVTYSQRNV